ncbi:MAG: hypothetical protein ABI336_04295 [Humibacillus sp.]
MLRAAARGAAGGLCWGLLARLFMRLVASTPEFTWGGTLLILGLSTLLGVGLGLVVGARRSGRSRWWRLAPVPGLVLFLSPGAVLLPGAALVAVAVAVRSARRRAVLLVVAVASVVVLARGLDAETAGQTSVAGAVGLGLVVLSTGLLGLGLHEWWRRWEPRRAARDGAGVILPEPDGRSWGRPAPTH